MTTEMVIKNANASPTAVVMVIKGSDDLAMLDVMKSICDVFGITREAFFKCDYSQTSRFEVASDIYNVTFLQC